MRRLNRIDDLQWIAETVRMEAEGESFLGKLGVAYTIVNRADQGNQSIPDVILRNRQFSAWNQDSPTRMTIDSTPDDVYTDCYAAACAAYFRLQPDPTKGANHYLNVESVLKVYGVLPSWASYPTDRTHVNSALVKARIGRHTFLKL